jgi:hypothetical protein
MYRTLSNLTMLALESQQVIFLRMAKIAMCSPDAITEMRRMTTEKMDAAIREGVRAAKGASQDSIIRGYRKRVRANIRRLSK